MAPNPIDSSGTSPIQPTKPPGRETPGLGAGEEAQEPKPFSLSPEPLKGEAPEGAKEGRPSPMEAAKELGDQSKAKQQELAPEQLASKINDLHDRLGQVKTNLTKPEVTKSFTEDHNTALVKTSDRLGKDVQSIAKNTGGEYSPPIKDKAQSALDFVIKFVDGSQGQLRNAMSYLGKLKKPDYTQMLSLQYAVQRASQKGELMSSIIGASVSGIKTILSTQLG